MSRGRVAVLALGLALVVVAGLVPPWTEMLHDGSAPSHTAIGYAPLFAPPEPQSYYHGVGIDYARLILTWTVIGLSTAGGWLIMRLWARAKTKAKRASPWRSVAQRLLWWQLVSMCVPVLLIIKMIGFIARLVLADPAWPAAVRGWMVIELLAGLLIVVVLVHAEWQNARPTRQIGQQIVGLLGLAMLGAATVLASWTMEARAALLELQSLGWLQLIGGLIMAWAAKRIADGRGAQLDQLVTHLGRIGVPEAFLVECGARADELPASYLIQRDEPKRSMEPDALLQAVARGEVFLPADVRVVMEHATRDAAPA